MKLSAPSDYTEAAKALYPFDGALCEVASLEKDRRSRHANQRPGGHVSCYAIAAQYVTDSEQQLPFTITILYLRRTEFVM